MYLDGKRDFFIIINHLEKIYFLLSFFFTNSFFKRITRQNLLSALIKMNKIYIYIYIFFILKKLMEMHPLCTAWWVLKSLQVLTRIKKTKSQ